MRSKLVFITLFSVFSIEAFSQGKRTFTHTTVFEIFANKESGFSNEPITFLNKGFGVELSTFNGIYILKKFSLSIGVGIAFNVDDAFKSLPIVGDLKWHLNDYGYNSPYVQLNTGRNLKINGFEGGLSAKFGIGYSFESDYTFLYVVEFFLKSKEYLLDKKTGYNYQTDSIGLSLGIKFWKIINTWKKHFLL